jgi:WD40 repeat protein
VTRIGLTFAVVAMSASHVRAQQATEIRLDTPSPLLMTMLARSGGIVAGVSSDHKLRVWDSRTKRVSYAIDVAGRDVAWTAISDDGRLMLMADYTAHVTIWNTATGRVEWEFKTPRYLTAAAFSRDGRLLAVAPGTPVQLYDVGTHRLLRELESTTGTTSVVFSRDARSLATSDGDGVHIYDVRSGKLTAKNADFVSEPLAVDFSADGKSVFASGGDRTVLQIDAGTGKTLRRSATLTDPVFYLETSPNGREAAFVTQNADDPQRPAPVVFTDAGSVAVRSTWVSPAGALLPGATWTSDGHFLLVTQSAGTLHVWTVR